MQTPFHRAKHSHVVFTCLWFFRVSVSRTLWRWLSSSGDTFTANKKERSWGAGGEPVEKTLSKQSFDSKFSKPWVRHNGFSFLHLLSISQSFSLVPVCVTQPPKLSSTSPTCCVTGSACSLLGYKHFLLPTRVLYSEFRKTAVQGPQYSWRGSLPQSGPIALPKGLAKNVRVKTTHWPI